VALLCLCCCLPAIVRSVAWATRGSPARGCAPTPISGSVRSSTRRARHPPALVDSEIETRRPPIGRRTQEQRAERQQGGDHQPLRPGDDGAAAARWRSFDAATTPLVRRGSQSLAVRKPGGSEESNWLSSPTRSSDFNGGLYGLLLRAFPLARATRRAAGIQDGETIEEVRFVVAGRDGARRGGVPVQTCKSKPRLRISGDDFWLGDTALHHPAQLPAKGGTVLYRCVTAVACAGRPGVRRIRRFFKRCKWTPRGLGLAVSTRRHSRPAPSASGAAGTSRVHNRIMR